MARKPRNAALPPEDPSVELARLADALNLTAIRDEISSLLARAEKEGLSYSDFALVLFRFEATSRESRRLTRNLKRSRLPDGIQDLDSFDFSLRPKLDAPVVKELLNCRWIEEGGRNIICVGRPGLGKSRILDNLGRAACFRGYFVLKINTAEMLEALHASTADATFKRTFRRYEKPDVLILESC
jgi:DNA replication protein DnaC